MQNAKEFMNPMQASGRNQKAMQPERGWSDLLTSSQLVKKLKT